VERASRQKVEQGQSALDADTGEEASGISKGVRRDPINQSKGGTRVMGGSRAGGTGFSSGVAGCYRGQQE
jgi:hypothetical protein